MDRLQPVRCKPLSCSAKADISIHRGIFFSLLFYFVFEYHFAHEPWLNNRDPPRTSAVQIPSLGDVTVTCVPCDLRIMQTKAQYMKTHLSILIYIWIFLKKIKKSSDSLSKKREGGPLCLCLLACFSPVTVDLGGSIVSVHKGVLHMPSFGTLKAFSFITSRRCIKKLTVP